MRNELTTRNFDFPSFGGRFPSLFDTKAFDALFNSLMGSIKEDNWTVSHLLGNTSGLPCDLKVVNDAQGAPIKTIIEYAIAGYSDNDILVTVDDDKELLNIIVSKTEAEEDKNAKFLQKRILKRSFNASYNLTGIDSKNIIANTKDGVLKVELPHLKIDNGKTVTRRIDINASNKVIAASKNLDQKD